MKVDEPLKNNFFCLLMMIILKVKALKELEETHYSSLSDTKV
jgi:hypothetical protein